MSGSPPSPEEIEIETPTEADVTTGHYHVSGMRSHNGASQCLVNDSGDPALIGTTEGDIYLNAEGLTQITSTTHFHKVTGRVIEFFGSVHRQVVADETVLIGKNDTLHINGSQTVSVVGSHTINIGKKQSVRVWSGQRSEVISGDRTMDVQSGGEDITVAAGDVVLEVAGGLQKEIIKKRQLFCAGECSRKTLGPYIDLKGSTELSLTGSLKTTIAISGEAVGTLGAFAKIEHASGKETNLAVKVETTCGAIGEKAGNITEKNIARKIETKKRQEHIAMLKRKAKLALDNKANEIIKAKLYIEK